MTPKDLGQKVGMWMAVGVFWLTVLTFRHLF